MTSTDELSQMLAKQLLDIGAVSLSPDRPFTWVSGLKSPVYCDNRLTLAYPRVRETIAEGFEHVIQAQSLPCDVIAGIATAGIPHAAWLSDRMQKPMIYVRSTAKPHGRQQQIEGALEKGANVVLIEDLVSTGMSSTSAISPVTEAGGHVTAVLAIFTYGLSRAREAFVAADTRLFTLTDFPMLIQVARSSGAISDSDLESLTNWYADPVTWSAKVID